MKQGIAGITWLKLESAFDDSSIPLFFLNVLYADMNPVKKNKRTPEQPKEPPLRSESLWDAIQRKYLKEAEILVRRDPQNINEYGPNGYNALEESLSAGLEFIEMLIEHGVNLNQQDQEGITALHQAVRRANLETVALLLKHGASCSLRTHNDRDAVHQAIYIGNLQMLKLLLGSGLVDITTKNKRGDGYLAFHVKNSDHSEDSSELARELMDHGIPADHLKRALSLAKKNVNSRCLKVIQERVFVLEEQKALNKVVLKVVGQSSEASEVEDDSVLPRQKKSRSL